MLCLDTMQPSRLAKQHRFSDTPQQSATSPSLHTSSSSNVNIPIPLQLLPRLLNQTPKLIDIIPTTREPRHLRRMSQNILSALISPELSKPPHCLIGTLGVKDPSSRDSR